MCVALLGIAIIGVGAGYYFYVQPILESSLERPEALDEIGIAAGQNLLRREAFIEDSRLGVVTDIRLGDFVSAPGVELGVASNQGALFCTFQGRPLEMTTFAKEAAHVDIIESGSDGVYYFMNRGGRGEGASLIDSEGNDIWTYSSFWGIDDMASGDLDGDGNLEFVVGFNGGGGVRLLDREGKEVWREIRLARVTAHPLAHPLVHPASRSRPHTSAALRSPMGGRC